MSILYGLSLVFFGACSVYVFLGVYILLLNMNGVLNRLFFGICMALSIWAFSFSMVNYTQDYEIVFFWRRVAAFGWGTIFSFLLHFLAILTHYDKYLKKSWYAVFVYIPAVITVYVYCISENLALGQFNLQQTTVGWVNISVNNGWDWFYNVYYSLFTVLGIFMLWKWGKNTTDRKTKLQSRIMLFSFVAAMTFGTMTEMVINKIFEIKIPQIAPIVAIIPISLIYYSVKKFGFMLQENLPASEPGTILNYSNRNKLFQNTSLVLIIGGLINFLTQFYFKNGSLNSVLLFSFFLFAIGAVLQIVLRMPLDLEVKSVLFVVILSCSVPIITLRFINTAGNTIWVSTIIFILISVVFNKKYFLFGLGIAAIITEIVIWILKPTIQITLTKADYLARIGILCLAVWTAYYINRIYINRLLENEEQMRFQMVVSKISGNLISISDATLDEEIYSFLKLSGEYFQVERTFFISLSSKYKNYEWHQDGIQEIVEHVPGLGSNEYNWWIEQVQKSDVICYSDVATIPDEGQKERSLFMENGIKSFLAMPLGRKGKIYGFLFYASFSEKRVCKDNHKALMKILANLLSDGLLKLETEKEINYMAYFDSLTNIPNRALFKNLLTQEIYHAKRNANLIGVIFIDLDSFKLVNDTIGHMGGNELLKEVALRLNSCIRKNDTVSRFGGDEFVIQLTQINNSEDIKHIAEKIIKALSVPICIREQEFYVTASLGIAIYPIDGEEAEELIKNADLAMYNSKESGKCRYTFCSQDIKDDVLKKMKLTNSLYRALSKDEIFICYQPQIKISTGEIIGCEALLRWNNHEYGMIPPNVFIPLAEQTGLIFPLGKYVIENACKQNKKWQDEGREPLRMSVNLSVEQFRDRKLIGILKDILDETGLDPQYLELEITESTAVESEVHAIGMLEEMKALGVSISIDDFGTQYSSLSRLKALPIDQLKIDIQFIRNIAEGKKDRAIVKTIIQLAKNLELNVIAEGVETKEQVDFLEKEMCDEIQGFYYYKPMRPEEMEKYLKIHKQQE